MNEFKIGEKIIVEGSNDEANGRIGTLLCLTSDGIEGEVKTFDMDREGSKEILNAEFSKLISEKFEGLDYCGEETDMTVEEVIVDAIQNKYEYCGYEVKVQVIFSTLL